MWCIYLQDFWSLYLAVKFWGYRVCQCSICNDELLFKDSYLIYLPNSSVWEFSLLQELLTNIWYCETFNPFQTGNWVNSISGDFIYVSWLLIRLIIIRNLLAIGILFSKYSLEHFWLSLYWVVFFIDWYKLLILALIILWVTSFKYLLHAIVCLFTSLWYLLIKQCILFLFV